MGSILSKLSSAQLQDAWRLTVHHDYEAAQAFDLELSERLGAALELELAAQIAEAA